MKSNRATHIEVCWLVNISRVNMQVSKAKGTRKDKKGAWGMPVALGGDEGRDKLR